MATIRAAVTVCALCLLLVIAGLGQRAEAVDGTGRIEVNAMEYPWSAIGRVNAGGRGYCTGFLISERQVITAAHCLYDPVVGRWRGAIELHFIAGYQRDRFILHSKVQSYVRAQEFRYADGGTVKSAVRDWAILTLQKPLGRQAGWLGVKKLDSLLMSRIKGGDALLLQAGYRRDRAHVMSADWGCRFQGIALRGRLITHDCNVIKGDSGSPLMVFSDGAFHAIGLHVIDLKSNDKPTLAGVLSFSLFHPKGGEGEAIAAFRRTSARWQEGSPPVEDSRAANVPLKTIDSLLVGLGYLHRRDVGADDEARAQALSRFRADRGLAKSGGASVAVLGSLLLADTK